MRPKNVLCDGIRMIIALHVCCSLDELLVAKKIPFLSALATDKMLLVVVAVWWWDFEGSNSNNSNSEKIKT